VPDFRLIAFPALGVAAAIGAVMDAATRPGAWGHRIIGAPLLATHAFFAPVGMLSDLDALRIHEVLRQASLAAPIPKEPDVDVLLLSSREVFSTHYPPLVRWFSGMPLLRAWWVLSCTGVGLEVRRTGIADLELRTLGLGLLDHPWAMTYLLPQHAPPKGTVVNAGRMRAEVLEVGPAGPTRVKFTLPESLDDPKLVMLFPKPGGWERITPPSIGGVVSLPPAPW
jgi:hypothetical protein